jgi:hypothetical protein
MLFKLIIMIIFPFLNIKFIKIKVFYFNSCSKTTILIRIYKQKKLSIMNYLYKFLNINIKIYSIEMIYGNPRMFSAIIILLAFQAVNTI